jgi:hypothetical protein
MPITGTASPVVGIGLVNIGSALGGGVELRIDVSNLAPRRAHAEPATRDVEPMQNCRNATRLLISFMLGKIANLTPILLTPVRNRNQIKSLSIALSTAWVWSRTSNLPRMFVLMIARRYKHSAPPERLSNAFFEDYRDLFGPVIMASRAGSNLRPNVKKLEIVF